MSSTTANLGLYKPDMSDTVNSTIPQFSSNFDKIDSSLAEKAPYVSIEQYGNLKIAVSEGYDWTPAINQAISDIHASGKNMKLIFPNQTFFFASTLVLPTDIIYEGDNTTLIFRTGITGIQVKTDGLNMSGFTIKSNAQDFTKNSFGLLIATDKDSNNKYTTYTTDHIIQKVKVYNFTTSISLEAIYWCKFEDVHTYDDKFGITINKDVFTGSTGGDVVSCTTMYFTRVYCHGTHGSITPQTDSIAWTIYDTLNVIVNTCVGEWYGQSMYMRHCQAVSLRDYYEESITGSGFGIWVNDITGALLLDNLYMNNITDVGLYWEYARVVVNGGRALVNSNQYVLQRGDSGDYIEIVPIISSGGGSYEKSNGGWELLNKQPVSPPLMMASTLIPNNSFYLENNGKHLTYKDYNGVISSFRSFNSDVFTASANGTTSTYTIPHGLGVAPSVYFCQAAHPNTGVANLQYVTADANNLYVYFANNIAAGTNNVIIRWRAEI